MSLDVVGQRRSGLLLFCCLLVGAPRVDAALLTVAVTDSAGRAAGDAVVMARPVDRSAMPSSAELGRMVQRGQSFNPTVLAVTAGTSVEFPNEDRMRGFVFVADSPWFAVADENGTVRIADLPVGRYELVVWHPALGEQPVVRPGTVQISTDVVVSAQVPGEVVAVLQAPADDDPLAAKFRQRAR
jgi:plastocyanin